MLWGAGILRGLPAFLPPSFLPSGPPRRPSRRWVMSRHHLHDSARLAVEDWGGSGLKKKPNLAGWWGRLLCSSPRLLSCRVPRPINFQHTLKLWFARWGSQTCFHSNESNFRFGARINERGLTQVSVRDLDYVLSFVTLPCRRKRRTRRDIVEHTVVPTAVNAIYVLARRINILLLFLY